jgi:ParB family chromosome partitioning protein
MAKLAVNNAAGWNAGKTFYAKTARTSEIKIDPEISSVFKYKEHVLKEIIGNIRRSGYDKSQPIAVWQYQGELFVLDGHTRLAAAAAVGLDEVPVVVMDFEDKEDAILYTFERQVVRRNLEPSEIIFAVKLMMTRPGHKKHDGTGRSADQLAARLGISATYVYQTKKIIEQAPAETIAEIEAGDKSIKEVYTEITKPQREARKEAEKAAKANVQEFEAIHVNEARPASTEIEPADVVQTDTSEQAAVSKPESKHQSKALSILDNVLVTLKTILSEMEADGDEAGETNVQSRLDNMDDMNLCVQKLTEVKALISTPV